MTEQITFLFSTFLLVMLLLTVAFQTKARQINDLNVYTPLASKAFSQMYFIPLLMWEELSFSETVSW